MVKRGGVARASGRWTDAIFFSSVRTGEREGVVPLGVLSGEGIGPEVIAATLEVLSATGSATAARFEVRFGGPIGHEAELLCGRALTNDAVAFCESVFAEGGAVLAGPGGGRFVYDLRRRFDLFCKISPVRPSEVQAHIGRLNPSEVRNVDLLVVRENSGGVYMGESRDFDDPVEGHICEQSFRYSEREVRRIVEVAAALAAQKRGALAVVVKEGGMPGMTALWRDVAEEATRRFGVHPTFLNVDLAAYALIQTPRSFDVIVAPDLFGDVLADAAAVLLGARGFSFSGNFSAAGAAVYQTNHGCAADIAGSDRANPVGQICALAMAMRESFGLVREAEWIEQAVDEVLRLGFRTFDIAQEGRPVVGTREMGGHVAEAVARLARSAS
jgi:3-isopropylmalate dehydrogenase